MNRQQSYDMSQVGSAAVVKFFNAVYAWMCVGLAISALVAYATSRNVQTFKSVQQWFILLVLVELGLVFGIGAAVRRLGAGVGTVLFLVFAAVNGLMLSSLFLLVPHSTLANAFIITAGTFGAMSVYGMVTQRDLSPIGRVAYMALIGVILASVVSMFWHNSGLEVLINYVGVLVFVALTAYDTQKLRILAQQSADNPALAARMSILGSLTLYLDFINMFLFIVNIMMSNGRRR
jgi:FtsH-binding integral membrane protein